MNTAHDLGGTQGFGPIPDTEHQALFHAEWEKRVLSLTLAMGACGLWNIDQSRAARENMPPPLYLNSSYFEIWYAGLCRLMLQRGLVSEAELQTGESHQEAKRLAHILKFDQVATALAKGSPTNRDSTAVPRFKVGDRVQTLVMNPNSHTRLPRYARGRPGIIHQWHGAHVYPDQSAQFEAAPNAIQHLYTVEFNAVDLWGLDTTASAVFVDCWEPYFV